MSSSEDEDVPVGLRPPSSEGSDVERRARHTTLNGKGDTQRRKEQTDKPKLDFETSSSDESSNAAKGKKVNGHNSARSRSPAKRNDERRRSRVRSSSRDSDKPLWSKKRSSSSSRSRSPQNRRRRNRSPEKSRDRETRRERSKERSRSRSVTRRRRRHSSDDRRERRRSRSHSASPPPRDRRRGHDRNAGEDRRRGRSRSPQANRNTRRSRSRSIERRHNRSRSPNERKRSLSPPSGAPRHSRTRSNGEEEERDVEMKSVKSEEDSRRSHSPPAVERAERDGKWTKGYNVRRRQDGESEDEEEKRAKWENERWIRRRDQRMDVLRYGESRIWGRSPTHRDIEQAYLLQEEEEKTKEDQEKKGKELKEKREKEKRKEEKKRNTQVTRKGASDSNNSDSESSSSEEERKKKKKRKKAKKEKKQKKLKKDKKDKKKKKNKKSADSEKESGDEEDEWVEVTAQMRADQAKEEEDLPGPAIPEHLLKGPQAAAAASNIKANYGKDMLRGEAANMAAYVARGERIPRRGEIGLSSAEIQEYEKVGYVMSGTRHKAMEATRLRKENQILTAEEKRMLSGFSHTERKKKEEAVLGQFRQLINSTKAKD